MSSSSTQLVTQSVAYEHDGLKFESYLAYDAARVSATSKVPGVLVIGEWWGLDAHTKERVEQIASLGYVAFGVDMYGGGTTTTDPKKAGELAGQLYGKPAMQQRARAGLDALLKNSRVDASRVAAAGYCFGGSTAQVLAYSGAPLAGIASFHGGLIAPPAKPASAAKFLICHGAIDPFIAPADLASFLKGMDEGKYDYQFISYGGALHAFTNPQSDANALRTGLKGLGYNADADRRSWQHLGLFFDEIFAVKT